MRSRVSRLNFTRESSFKSTPLDWVLANVFEDFNRFSVVLSGCEQNKTARSEIYQRHRHSNLPLDQKFHFLTSQFWNKFNVICSTVWSSLPFLARRRWWHIGVAPTNQHKTGSRPLKKIIQKKKTALTARVITGAVGAPENDSNYVNIWVVKSIRLTKKTVGNVFLGLFSDLKEVKGRAIIVILELMCIWYRYKLNSLHSSVGRASHRYRGEHGFESRWSLGMFSGLFCNCLTCFITARITFTSNRYSSWYR